MKKLLFVLGFAFALSAVNAQVEKGPVVTQHVTNDVTVNADTTITLVRGIGSGLASLDVEVKLLSGTIGGKAYLWGRSGARSNLLDSSAVFTASVPWKTFLFDRTKYTYYKDYSIEYRTTGTQTSYIIVTAVRRPEE